MFGVAVAPSILLALGMVFSPESPRWLFQVFFARLCSHIWLECFYMGFSFFISAVHFIHFILVIGSTIKNLSQTHFFAAREDS